MYKALIAALAAAVPSGCGGDASGSAQPPADWKTGFWFWEGSSAEITASIPVDVIYAHSGTIQRRPPFDRQPWGVFGNLPDDLPDAREYWLVYRFNEAGLPTREVLPELRTHINEQLADARRGKLPVAGVQLDIDSPTSQLPQYATFLKEVRGGLPSGVRLSITALLDWFRPGTAIADVVKHTDEFVPQFYDTGERDGREAIAAPVDARKWGPIFERLGKPYRIGASSFGRARFVPKPEPSGAPGTMLMVMADLSPLEVALLPGMRRNDTPTAAGELRLIYEVTKSTRVGWNRLSPGDQFEFIFPTAASMEGAVAAAKAMGPHCSGILFFRWPAFEETMAAQPDQVLRAAAAIDRPPSVQLHRQEKGCAAVRCTDLFITDAEPLNAQPLRYTIRSSVELEYFIPAERTPARMLGPDTIELSLPPFLGRSRVYLGRAVTAKPAEFRMEGLTR
jgi:hypothetical protein